MRDAIAKLVAASAVPALVLLSVSQPAQAQNAGADGVSPDTLPALPDSGLIRVWAPEVDLKRSTLVFRSWTDSTLEASDREHGAPMALPYRQITRIDLRTSQSVGLGMLRGAGIGGLIGGVVGLIAGSSATSDCDGFLCGLDALNYLAAGTGIGAGAGLLIGAAKPVDVWTRQELPASLGFPEPHRDSQIGNVLLVAGGLALLLALGG